MCEDDLAFCTGTSQGDNLVIVPAGPPTFCLKLRFLESSDTRNKDVIHTLFVKYTKKKLKKNNSLLGDFDKSYALPLKQEESAE